MKKKLLLFFVVFLSVMSLWSAPTMPAIGSYYMIQFARQASNSKVWQDNGTGAAVSQAVLTGADAQWWKLVSDGNGKYYLESKLGHRLYYTSPKCYTGDVATVTTVYSLVATTNTTWANRWEFQRSGGTNGINDDSGTGLCEYSMADAGNPVNFLDPATALATLITSAETVYAAFGANPGMYDQSSPNKLALRTAIDAATTVKNNTSATDDDRIAALATLNTKVTEAKATTLTTFKYSVDGGTTTWYAIACAIRKPNNYLVDPGIGKQPTGKPLLSLRMFWKVINDGGGNIRIKGSYSGAQFTNQTAASQKVLLTTTDQVRTLTSLSIPYYYNIKGGGYSLHLDGSSTLVGWNNTAADGGSAFRFEELTLVNAITIAQSEIASFAYGVSPGYFPKTVASSYEAAIQLAINVRDNVSATDAEKNQAINDLLTASNTFYDYVTANTTRPVVSTPGNEKWYFLKGQRGPTTTSLWETAKVDNSRVEHKTLTGADNQLWKLVENATGVALQNKGTGAFLNSDNSTSGSLITMASSMPANALTIAASPYWASAFTISGTSFNVHVGVDAVGWSLQNYNGGSDNCSLRFLDPADVIVMAVAEVQSIYNNAVMGTKPGQKSQETMNALAGAIDIAKLVRDNPSALSSDVIAAINSLYTALDVFNASYNSYKLSDQNSTTWYTIKNGKGQYLKENGLKANVTCGIDLNSEEYQFKIVAQGTDSVSLVSRKSNGYLSTPLNNWDSSTPSSLTSVVTKQLIHLIPNTAQFYIDCNVNSATRRFYILASSKILISNVGSVGAETEASFILDETPLSQQTITFGVLDNKKVGDVAFDLNATASSTLPVTYTSSNSSVATVAGSTVTIVGEGETDITASQSGDFTYDAAASVVQRLTVSTVTGLGRAESSIIVTVKERRIVVAGTVAPVQIFSVTGAKLNPAAVLSNGVYIVKVDGKQFKVSVQ